MKKDISRNMIRVCILLEMRDFFMMAVCVWTQMFEAVSGQDCKNVLPKRTTLLSSYIINIFEKKTSAFFSSRKTRHAVNVQEKRLSAQEWML